MFKSFASVSCIHLSGSVSITYSLSQGQGTGAPCPNPSHTSYSQANPNAGSRFLHALVFNYKTTQCYTGLSLTWILLWLMALIGAPNSILFPHAEKVVFFPQVCPTVEPPPNILSPGVRTAFYLFPPSFTSTVSFTTISTDILFLPFPFLHYLPITSPFSSFYFLFFVYFYVLPVLLRHFSSCPSVP